VVFGSEKFHQYAYGREVTVQTDHKPLEAIIQKPLHMALKRLQRLLRSLVYDITLTYRPRQQMQLADTLSRAYLPHTDTTNVEAEVQDINMIEDLHLAAARLENIQTHTASGDNLQV